MPSLIRYAFTNKACLSISNFTAQVLTPYQYPFPRPTAHSRQKGGIILAEPRRKKNAHHLADVVGVAASRPEADVDKFPSILRVGFEVSLLVIGRHLNIIVVETELLVVVATTRGGGGGYVCMNIRCLISLRNPLRTHKKTIRSIIPCKTAGFVIKRHAKKNYEYS